MRCISCTKIKKLSANFSVFTNDRDYKLKNYVGYKCLLRKVKKIQNKKEQISLIELLLLPMLEIEKIVIVGIPVTSIRRKRFGAREYSGGRLELTYCNVDKYTAITQLRKMGCIKDGDKLFEARYHMFIRGIEGVFVTLKPSNKLFVNKMETYKEDPFDEESKF